MKKNKQKSENNISVNNNDTIKILGKTITDSVMDIIIKKKLDVTDIELAAAMGFSLIFLITHAGRSQDE